MGVLMDQNISHKAYPVLQDYLICLLSWKGDGSWLKIGQYECSPALSRHPFAAKMEISDRGRPMSNQWLNLLWTRLGCCYLNMSPSLCEVNIEPFLNVCVWYRSRFYFWSNVEVSTKGAEQSGSMCWFWCCVIWFVHCKVGVAQGKDDLMALLHSGVLVRGGCWSAVMLVSIKYCCIMSNVYVL